MFMRLSAATRIARRIFCSVFAALAVASSVLGGAGLPSWAQEAAAKEAADTQVFDEAWRLVRDKFYDRNLLGLDWEVIGNKYRADYSAAKTAAGHSAAINAMLGELHASHTRHYTKDEPAYYELADIFSHALRRDIPRYFPNEKVTYPGIGIFTKQIEGKTFISGVLAGLPADKAGLLVGDEVLSADDAPFEPIGSFRGRAGMTAVLQIRRAADGPVTNVTVTPEQIQPGDAFEAALKDSARIIESNGRRIAYIHLWSYAGHRYQDLLEEALSTGKLKDADALIWDLRDGWGGADPRYLRIFDPHGPTMTLTERDGDTHVVGFRWRKPVALLINNGTRSGKEVLAFGFKKNGYGEVIGERTAGTLLAATAFLLSDGSLLVLAVQNASVDGERLEGKGVQPTIELPNVLPYAAGKDAQLDKAIEVLANGS